MVQPWQFPPFHLQRTMKFRIFLPVILIFFLELLSHCPSVEAQVSWTPIHVDSSNHLDLWTVTESGCECAENRSKTQCACCVKPGGCLCTYNNNKCTQCGLEDSCQRSCNVTISSRIIASKSGLSWAQIKSPFLEGPTTCYWRLLSAPGQRIQVQIHRLISVGAFDNSTQKCNNGFVQFADGDHTVPSSQAIQLCGENNRFSPPAVLFGDQSIATLLLRLDVKTTRSQLLAFVSFSSADDPKVGDPVKGGRLRPHSACDWTYERCWAQECTLASPGYPGLFPPHRRCRYYLSANSTTDTIRLHFHSISFPQPLLCSVHHVAIWRRNATIGAPWKTLCENKESLIDISGGHAVVEFRSGATSLPYAYSGFVATVIIQKSATAKPVLAITSTTTTTTAIVPRQHHPSTHAPPKKLLPLPGRTTTLPPYRRNEIYREQPLGNERIPQEPEGVYQISCGHIFKGETTRGHVFRLLIPADLTLRPRGGLLGFGSYYPPKNQAPPGPFKCQIEFRGRPTDIVQFASFSYRFRGSNCSTVMEVYDMDENHGNHSDRLMGTLCGPAGNEVRRFTSSHNRMALVTLVFPYDDPFASEFLEGAFRFHDESVEGTVKPMSNCEVVYYGVASAPSGTVRGPPDSPLLRLSTFPLVCAHSFLPGLNQSVSLTLNRAGHDTLSVALPNSLNYCRSICGGSGCRCEAKHASLDEIDHLLLLTGSTLIGCLCGYFRDILPMMFESHTPLTLVYHATKGGQEFSYSVGFQFKTKVTCANFTIAPPSGYKRWKEILGSGIFGRSSHHYTHFECIWLISIPSRYKLELEFISEENEEDCRAWNLTVWAGNERTALDPELNDLIAFFCPKYGRSEIQVPDGVQSAYIKLLGVTLRPPQFEIRWRYIDVILGSGQHLEKAISNSSILKSIDGYWYSLIVTYIMTYSFKLFR